MSGTLDLNELLEGMQPELEENTAYIFLSIPRELAERNSAVVGQLAATHAIATFRESEGLTLVVSSSFLPKYVASPSSNATFLNEEVREYLRSFAEKEELPRMSHITMRIHSSLSAVGFTAAFSRALTDAAISCNVFAGYFHDHIFVPADAESRAMSVLTKLSQKSH